MGRSRQKGARKSVPRGSLGSKSSRGAIEPEMMDDVDRFDAARDKILLDGNEEDDDANEFDFGSGEREVLGFDKDSNREDDRGAVADDASAGEGSSADDDDDERYRTMALPKGRDPSRIAPRDRARESDEESDAGSDASDEDAMGWGANKRTYYSGNTAEDLESDSEIDEEKARALEMAEATKLQRLSRAGMSDDAFGLAEIDAAEAQANANESSVAAREKRRRELDAEPRGDNETSGHAPEQLVEDLARKFPLALALVQEYNARLAEMPLAHESALESMSTEDESRSQLLCVYDRAYRE